MSNAERATDIPVTTTDELPVKSGTPDDALKLSDAASGADMIETLVAGQCRLFNEADMAAPVEISLGMGTAVVISMTAPDKTTPNEDTAAIFRIGDDAAILVLADGAGGTRGGGQASTIVLEEMQKAIAKAAAENDGVVEDLRGVILDGCENANLQVQALGTGAGSTLCVVEIRGRTARPYHVGDSQILAVGQRGKIKLQTTPHSPVSYAVQAGLLGADDAVLHAERHLVSNMVGLSDMHIAMGSSVELAPRDTLLLASDGLSDNLFPEEILQATRKGPLAAAAARLSELARKRMTEAVEGQPCAPDDLTIVLYRPDTSPSESRETSSDFSD